MKFKRSEPGGKEGKQWRRDVFLKGLKIQLRIEINELRNLFLLTHDLLYLS